jgi:hypothetical protein
MDDKFKELIKIEWKSLEEVSRELREELRKLNELKKRK